MSPELPAWISPPAPPDAERRAEGQVQVVRTERAGLITMLDPTNHNRRGIAAATLRPARTPITEWNALESGVQVIPTRGPRRAPAGRRRILAPPPCSEQAALAEVAERPAEAFIRTMFKRRSLRETGLVAQAGGF
ncbi:hypothetical protein [Bradyrhizobium genosp. P]|uniref:hypothetical protein n=1 Tax=Bradyrhizobium genosp. P TaxID=83641 RepID=UPI003CEBF401